MEDIEHVNADIRAININTGIELMYNELIGCTEWVYVDFGYWLDIKATIIVLK